MLKEGRGSFILKYMFFFRFSSEIFGHIRQLWNEVAFFIDYTPALWNLYLAVTPPIRIGDRFLQVRL